MARWLSQILAWLVGYYWEPCPVCGHGVAILNSGRIVAFCSRSKHAQRPTKGDE